MFRSTLVSPVVVLVAAAAGFVACRAAGVNPHPRAMLLACAVGVFAAEAAMIPVALAPKDPPSLIQATFLGTVIHLGLAAILGIVAMLALAPGAGFVYWLLAIYWLTLLATSAVFIRLVRAKPAAATAPPSAAN